METKTLKSALEFGILYLQRHGVPDGRTDAWLLLSHVCKISHSMYYMDPQQTMEQNQYEEYEKLLTLRGKRIPLQQITGTAWFYGLDFAVNEHVLIPRQDTEILVEEALKRLCGNGSVLDLCTGSGCVLLALLSRRPDASGLGIDLSAKALLVAEENLRRHPAAAEFKESDLFSGVEGRFDLIVSNPPYIVSSVIPTLMEEVREHEPLMALDGGEDGLVFYRKIATKAPAYLNAGGWLCMEIGYDQGRAVEDLLVNAGFSHVTVTKDLAGLDRVVCGQKT